LRRFLILGSVVCFVCALSFGPYLVLGGIEQLPQILARLFPFKRGLCHAYWAPNTWALYNLADKAGIALHSRLPSTLSSLVPLAAAGSGPSFTGGLVHDSDAHRLLPNITPGRTLALVGLALLPAMAKLWRRPSQRNFAACLIYSSFCFFMLSWHVHEKAILMATVPLAPLVFALGTTDSKGQGSPTAYRLFLLLAMTGHLSLFPLREHLPRSSDIFPFRARMHCTPRASFVRVAACLVQCIRPPSGAGR
jgi:alpha-1,3-glucosyltransferase